MKNWTQSWTVKVASIGILALLLGIPLAYVGSLVNERVELRQQAVAKIAQGWGGEQVLGGLVLSVPTRRVAMLETGKGPVENVVDDSLTILPSVASMNIAMSVEKRHYGIYEAPVFTANVLLRGQFSAEDLVALRQADNGTTWQDGRAQLRLVLKDLSGLREVTLLVNGKSLPFASSTATIGAITTVTAPIDLSTLRGQTLDYTLNVRIDGTQSLMLLPLARTINVDMHAPWSDPSFIGAILPAERRVDAQGFRAHWSTLDLNRGYGQYWNAQRGAPESTLIQNSAFGVALYQPVDVYQRNERSIKYGLLFIAMTFATFFLFEVLKRLRVHPVQYLLVGIALTSFYVLLLAMSEQIGFDWAYVVAAASVILIVSGYASSVLRARKAAYVLGGILTLVYGVLYGLLAAEQYALLAGAIVLFTTVALLMYLTRRVDWYAASSATTQGS